MRELTTGGGKLFHNLITEEKNENLKESVCRTPGPNVGDTPRDMLLPVQHR